MKTNQKRLAQALACCVCAAVAPSALAGAQPGFYLGISGGKSTFDLDKEEFDDIALDAFFSEGVPVLSATSTFDDSDKTLAVFAGYRLNPYLAVEGGYLDLGTAKYRFTGTVNPPGPATSAPSAVSMDVETKGFSIAGLGGVPIGNVVDLHARLGLFIAKTEVSAAVTIDSGTGSDSDSVTETNAFIGVGAGFHLGNHWSLGVDWTRHINVSEQDEDDDEDSSEGFDVDALSVSVTFTF